MAQMSKEYAEALFALAVEEDSIEKIWEGLNLFTLLLFENPEYEDFLSSPAIPLEARIAALEAAISSKVHDYVLSFIAILIKRRDLRLFRSAVREFELLSNAAKSISEAEVISAVALTEEEKQKLTAKLETLCGHSVIINCSIDKELIGGLIVKFDGKVIDGSLKNRLREVKGQIRE